MELCESDNLTVQETKPVGDKWRLPINLMDYLAKDYSPFSTIAPD